MAASPAPSTESDGHSADMHGDHTPRHGGTVYMNGDLHFEVVLSRTGTHRIYFSDATRAELPAATASDVTVTLSSAEGPIETLKAEVDESGESWMATGSRPKGDDVTARVAFVIDNEPYWIDVPFIDAPADAPHSSIERAAGRYLELVADLGRHNPESVDFQIARTTTAPQRALRRLSEIVGQARMLAAHISDAHSRSGDSSERAESLVAQLEAIASRIDQLSGKRLSLEDELHRLFAVDLRQVSADRFRLKPEATGDVRAELAERLPGSGALSQRLSDYQRRFVIPRPRLHAVVTRSIAACRNQTRRLLTLPEGEELAVEYVADRPWSGYSVYRGLYKSVMLVNRTLPLSVGQVLNLACHEGYPGHHVYNSLREQHFVRARGWAEATALPIFSPEGFRAEAMAAAAAAIAFTPDERLRLFRDELLPLVRLDANEAERYVEVCDLVDRLSGAITLVVEKYLAGELSAAQAAEALQHDALMEHPEGLLGYVDRYRGYALAYTFGRDRILSTLTERTRSVEGRWALLNQLMTSPEHLEDGPALAGPSSDSTTHEPR